MAAEEIVKFEEDEFNRVLENIEKPYRCEHCRKWFSTIYVRNQHMTRCFLNNDEVEPAPIVKKKTTKFILDMANCLLKQLEIAKACQRLNVVLSHLVSPDLVRDQVIPSSTKKPFRTYLYFTKD